MAIGESDAHRDVLRTVSRLLQGWTAPVVNRATETIRDLTRDGASTRLADEPSLLAPINVRVTRERLVALALGQVKAGDFIAGAEFPLIVRPVGLHAGDGLARLATPEDIAGYLTERRNAEFFIAPYVDYAGDDGLFRKQRIVFINGRAYPSHQATSEHWIVHYLSAGMTENAARRDEEARWMETFDTDFALRHARAFEALCERMGLDYFGIDSAETKDGRLLVFEVDVAMIVHALDSAEVFPYKKPAMKRLFGAFLSMLEARADPRRTLKVVGG
jgi:glutathione synthase/RimK-type ligase-like ATP-grasp enzyme